MKLCEADFVFFCAEFHLHVLLCCPHLSQNLASHSLSHTCACTHIDTSSTFLHFNLLPQRHHLPSAPAAVICTSSHAEKVTVCVCEYLPVFTFVLRLFRCSSLLFEYNEPKETSS